MFKLILGDKPQSESIIQVLLIYIYIYIYSYQNKNSFKMTIENLVSFNRTELFEEQNSCSSFKWICGI